jgi:hypothetical protein
MAPGVFGFKNHPHTGPISPELANNWPASMRRCADRNCKRPMRTEPASDLFCKRCKRMDAIKERQAAR